MFLSGNCAPLLSMVDSNASSVFVMDLFVPVEFVTVIDELIYKPKKHEWGKYIIVKKSLIYIFLIPNLNKKLVMTTYPHHIRYSGFK